MQVISFFRNMDLFGAHLFNKVEKDKQAFRSPIGGLVSFLIFSSSLAYAIWVFYLWGEHQYTAKISNSVYASDFKLLNLEYDVIRINFWKFSTDAIDPFKEKILIPIVTYTINYTSPMTYVLNVSNETAYSGTNYIIPEMKLGFTNIDGAIMTTSEMFVQIIKCTPELLTEGEECASQEISDKFFSQALNTIIMQVHYKQLDSKDGALQESVQEFLLQIERESCYTLNTYLQTTFYEVRSSFLFAKPDYYEYINGALIQPQTNTVQYCTQAYGYEAYLVMYIAMKGNQVKNIFEYPTAGDLFANIGSIVSLLFMMKHIIIFVNARFLNHQLIHQVMQFYYPQLSKVRIQRNWKRKIIQVFLQDEQLDLIEFNKFYKRNYEKIAQKLTFSNLIYELSRIKIILKNLRSSEELRCSHLVGVALDNMLITHKIFDPSLNSVPTTTRHNGYSSITEEDVSILSLQQREIEWRSNKETITTFNHRLTV